MSTPEQVTEAALGLNADGYSEADLVRTVHSPEHSNPTMSTPRSAAAARALDDPFCVEVEALKQLGKMLGLKTSALSSFVRTETDRRMTRKVQHDEASVQRQLLVQERSDRIAREENERRDRLRREDLERQDRERERQDKENERQDRIRRETSERDERAEVRREEREGRTLEMEALTRAMTTRSGAASGSGGGSFRVELRTLSDRDDVDKYLAQFEQIASSHKWDQAVWAPRLISKLTGKAWDGVSKLSPLDTADYEKVKKAILEEFHRTPQFYCNQFREIRKRTDENFKQFFVRLKSMLDRWISRADCNPKDANALYELFLREQLLISFHAELRTFVVEKKPTTAEQAAEMAYEHIEAKRDGKSVVSNIGAAKELVKGPVPGKTPRTAQSQSHGDAHSRGKPKKDVIRSLDTPTPDMSQVECWRCKKKGHYRSDCKARICLIKSPVPARKPLPASAALCEECEGKPLHKDGSCLVAGKEAQYLRDTGADNIVIKSKFVRPGDYTGDYKVIELADYSSERRCPTAIVDVDTPFLKGRIVAIIFDHVRPDIFIGDHAELEDGTWIDVPVYPRRDLLAAIETRAAKARNAHLPKEVPVIVVEGLDITPTRLHELQQADDSLSRSKRSAEEGIHINVKGNTISFKTSKGILKRHFVDSEGHHSQVCVPKSLRVGVMKLAHDTPMGGHLGAKKTRERIWAAFYWPGMCGDIRRYCQSCDRCQKVAPRGRVRKVPLGKVPLSDIPFEKVAVDLVGPITPASESGNRFILVMVDYATRYPEAVALKNIEAPTVAEALWNMWSRLGVPRHVLSDQGGQFTGQVMKEVQRLLAIKGQTTTPYHAQANGLVERFNGTLKTMLKKLCVEDPRSWDRLLPAVLFSYREVPQESTGYSPFELLYGRTVRGPMAILRDIWTREQQEGSAQPASAYVFQLRNRIAETCEIARKNLETEALRQKKFFDKKARVRTFQAGERVLLLLPEKKNKLEMAWRGPYVVQERVTECDYRIVIKGKPKLLHANLLKLYKERPTIAAGVCVVEETDRWESVTSTCEDIPLIPLVAEETIVDVKLDPEAPEIHAGIREILETMTGTLTDLPQRTVLSKCDIRLAHEKPMELDNFIDDILLATETMERHLECLRALFKRLQEVHLSA